MRKVLAIDMGATSIRGIIGYVESGELRFEEVMRLTHKTEMVDGRWRWQWDLIVKTITETILKYKDEIASVAIDTWGVDFGIIDKNGQLIETPIAYRDAKHQIGFDLALQSMDLATIFANTGTQIMPINTLFQLLTLRKLNPETFRKIDKVLMLPDLITYLLTGKMQGEETIWSTTQLMNLKNRKISTDILDKFDLPYDMFPDFVETGTIVGNTKDALIPELQGTNIDVVAVCGHDTASAVLLAGQDQEDSMFLSCGTWSLLGSKVPVANLSNQAFKCNLTNELGYNAGTLLFKNITGLYLFEKFKQQYEEKFKRSLRFSEINTYVLNSYAADPVERSLLDMDDPRFAADPIDAGTVIYEYLKERHMMLPMFDMDYFRIIYASLVAKYQETKADLEAIHGKKFKHLHLLGGGAKSESLQQLIQEKLDVTLTVGPFEASALGNIIVQLKAVGDIMTIEEGIQLALASGK